MGGLTMLKAKIENELKVENERVKEALKHGVVYIDPVEFFINNIESFEKEA